MKHLYLALFITPALLASPDVHAAQAPPFAESFDDASSLSAFTIINNNNDSKTWAWDSSTQAVKYSNTWKAADDYLVLPGLTLEEGKLYTFSFDAYRQSSFRTEKVAAYVGTGATVAELTTELLPPTEVMAQKIENQKETHALNFTPPASGVYYFAVKACSDASQLNLYVDNVAVTSAKVTEAPGAVRDFTVTPAPLGALKANISFRVPETTISGEPIDELDKVMIYRGDVLAATVDVTAGTDTPYTCTDDNAVYGETVYRAVAHNAGGDGLESRVTVFIGNDRPSAPASVTLRHGTADGDAVISWEAPATDIRGLSIDPATLTYTLKHTRPSQEWYEDLADGVSGNTYAYTECDPATEQAFYKYSVKAVNAAGEGDPVFSEMWIPLGRPDAVPYTESFAGGMLEHIFRTKIETGTGMWSMGDDDTQPGLQSADGDNGFIICNGGEAGDVGALYSGRIDLGTLPNPQLSFNYFNYGSDDTGFITVMVNSGEGFEPLGQPVFTGEGDEGAWNLTVFPMAEYAGKKIELAFKATMSDYKTVAIDNISIASQRAHDLSAVIEAPAKAVTGKGCPVTIAVTNEGAETSGDYTVTVYCNDEPVGSVESTGLASAAIERLTFTMPLTVFDTAGTVTIRALVNYDPDENLGNNTSNSVVTAIVNTNHPAPGALSGSRNDSGITLAWQAPDLTDGPRMQITDTFEDYGSFATWMAGDWTFVDMDKAAVDGPSDFDIPNVTAGQPASFFIMDTSGEDFTTYGFNAYSGDKVLAAVFNMRGIQNDDWAISPRLSGQPQAVTLRARSYSAKYPDSFEILYSTTDREPSSFTSVARYDEIPSAWKEYAAQLPAGAQYLAIRYISSDAFILMVDDVTFATPDCEPVNYEIEGYNIYRDRTLVDSVPAGENTYTDADAPEGTHLYHVTALYAGKGESDPSAPVTVGDSSIDTIGAATRHIVARGSQGHITVTGAEGLTVNVWAADGRLVAKTTGSEVTEIAAGNGIYVVDVHGHRIKVAVR